MQTPTKGRIVFVKVDPAMNNGDGYAPAMITRVFDSGLINVRVLCDAFTMPLHRTSVRLADIGDQDNASAVQHLPEDVAWWPPRV